MTEWARAWFGAAAKAFDSFVSAAAMKGRGSSSLYQGTWPPPSSAPRAVALSAPRLERAEAHEFLGEMAVHAGEHVA